MAEIPGCATFQMLGCFHQCINLRKISFCGHPTMFGFVVPLRVRGVFNHMFPHAEAEGANNPSSTTFATGQNETLTESGVGGVMRGKDGLAAQTM